MFQHNTRHLPTNPILASPVLATSNPSPAPPPPPPLGWMSSLRSLARRAFSIPMWWAVALLRWVRAICGRWTTVANSDFEVCRFFLPRPLSQLSSPVWSAWLLSYGWSNGCSPMAGLMAALLGYGWSNGCSPWLWLLRLLLYTLGALHTWLRNMGVSWAGCRRGRRVRANWYLELAGTLTVHQWWATEYN